MGAPPSDGFYKVSQNLGYNADEYRQAVFDLRKAREFLNDLPPEARKSALLIMQGAIRDTMRALREIYLPLIDERKMEEIKASPHQDFHTDLEGLDDLVKIFEE